MKKKISVCMATYNGERYIEEQLNSILPQLEARDEVIISDDSSTDRTVAIIESYKDFRIVIYKNQKFKSPIFNFENAIKKSTGDIIVLSDQDDVWKKNKIKVILKNFKNKKSLLLVMDNYVVDCNLNILHNSLYEYLNSGSGVIKNLYKNTYLGCNMAFTSNLKKYILPFPRYISMHDIWIGLTLNLFTEVIFSKEKTLLFRRHQNNATKMNENFFRVVFFRLYMACAIIANYFKKLGK